MTLVPRAAIVGLAGLSLTAAERRLFARADPLGFILFARNIESPAQVQALVASLRRAVGRADAPVLIDQEGGRVARLRAPHWRHPPAAARFAALAKARGRRAAREAAWLNARLMAGELLALGITVDCAPVLDLPVPGAHDVIGDRAHGRTPALAADLGGAVCAGLLAGGVLPVVKHIPGHGRAAVDSHHALPVVTAPLSRLARTDFAPFAMLADAPLAMTAHVVFAAVDPDHPATTSRRLVRDVIRRAIGFRGLLLSDDLAMQALAGSAAERAAAALAAGCDVALICPGRIEETRTVLAAVPPLSLAAQRRLAAARRQAARAQRDAQPFDRLAALARLERLLDGIG